MSLLFGSKDQNQIVRFLWQYYMSKQIYCCCQIMSPVIIWCHVHSHLHRSQTHQTFFFPCVKFMMFILQIWHSSNEFGTLQGQSKEMKIATSEVVVQKVFRSKPLVLVSKMPFSSLRKWRKEGGLKTFLFPIMHDLLWSSRQ